MLVTVTYPGSKLIPGRIHRLDQMRASQLITLISNLQDEVGEVNVRITVTEEK